MTLTQIIKVGLITLILILLILIVLRSTLFVLKKRELKDFLKKKKNRKNKKRFQKKRSILNKNVKKQRNRMIFLVILEVLMITGLYGFTYYQNVNITSSDSDLIVRGYFLVDDFTKEIEKASASSDDAEASKQNIKYLALSMATYTSKKANTSNTKEGQRLINKYYAKIGQLGMNATRDVDSFYGNKNDILASYKSELSRVKEIESSAFEFYKINANSLDNNAEK